MGAAITAGLSVCAVGMFFDVTPNYTSVDNIISGVDVEYIYTKKATTGIVAVAAKIVIVDIILNGRA